MKSIAISATPPRSTDDYRKQINFAKGLRGYFWYGNFFILSSLFILICPPYDLLDVMLFKALFGFPLFFAFGYFIRRIGQKKLAARREAFVNGAWATGTVQKNYLKFVPYKSWPDYAVSITVLADGREFQTTIQSSKKQIHTDLPVGSKVNCLFDKASGSILVPYELGYEFKPI